MSQPIERIHYRPDAFDFDRGRLYVQGDRGLKPHGFWYSATCDDDGWEHWCRGEDFHTEGLAVRYRVDVDLGRILVIDDPDVLRQFGERYRLDSDHCDWRRVAEDHAGIEIAPYQWSMRMDSWLWYYSWDCASGVVWDLTAIREVSRQREQESAK